MAQPPSYSTFRDTAWQYYQIAKCDLNNALQKVGDNLAIVADKVNDVSSGVISNLLQWATPRQQPEPPPREKIIEEGWVFTDEDI
jgi:hypothetical protein